MWGAALFLTGAGMLNLALESRPLHLGDPEYGQKLTHLRAQLAEASPGTPLVLVLGSSRVGTGIRPEVLLSNCCRPSTPPLLLFNFGLCCSDPVMELLCFRRLLADGIVPRHVFVEVTPLAFNDSFPASHGLTEHLDPRRWQWPDVRRLAQYHSQPRVLYRDWLETRLLPASRHRFLLLDRFAPCWVPPSLFQSLFGHEWHGTDRWGWLHLPGIPSVPSERRRQLLVEQRQLNYEVASRFHPAEASDRALRELVDLCRREEIVVSLLAMPDALRPCYSPACRAAIDDYLQQLSRECEVALVDARDWIDDGGFADLAHLTPNGAATFTRRFAREVLRPRLGGLPPPPSGPGWLSSAEPVQAFPAKWSHPTKKDEGR